MWHDRRATSWDKREVQSSSMDIHYYTVVTLIIYQPSQKTSISLQSLINDWPFTSRTFTEAVVLVNGDTNNTFLVSVKWKQQLSSKHAELLQLVVLLEVQTVILHVSLWLCATHTMSHWQMVCMLYPSAVLMCIEYEKHKWLRSCWW